MFTFFLLILFLSLSIQFCGSNANGHIWLNDTHVKWFEVDKIDGIMQSTNKRTNKHSPMVYSSTVDQFMNTEHWTSGQVNTEHTHGHGQETNRNVIKFFRSHIQPFIFKHFSYPECNCRTNFIPMAIYSRKSKNWKEMLKNYFEYG